MNKLKTLESQATKDDFIQWMALPLTKALFLRLEYEKEYSKDLWATGNIPPDQEKIEQGKALFVEEFIDAIKTSRADEEEDTDE